MNNFEGAQRPEPEGEGKDPSWTPQEPRRPFRPKPGGFGVEKSFPMDDIPSIPPEGFYMNRYIFGIDLARPDTESYSPEPPEEPNGSKE